MVKNLPTVERSTRIRFGKNCKDDQADNTIVFNASNVEINADYAGSVYMTPLRLREDLGDRNITVLAYNQLTKEVMDSCAIAEDILDFDLEAAVINGNVTGNTASFNNTITSITTLSNVGIANGSPIHTLDIGTNVAIDVVGSNVVSVLGGNVYIQKDLIVDGNAQINGVVTVVNTENLSITDAIVELGRNNTSGDATLDLGLLMNRPESNVVIGFREGTDEIVLGYTESGATSKTFSPKTDEDIDVHVYGRVLTEANVGIINTSPIHTLDVGSNLYVDEFGSNILVVRGNTNVTGDLTVDTNTLFVDSVENKVGVKTVDPHAELHVVGNAYVSSNLTVDVDTLHVDTVADHVGINTKEPAANLHVVGNAYVSSNLTVDVDTLHVDSVAVHVGFNTKEPAASLHIVGNAYVSSNLTVDVDTLHVDTVADHVGINTRNPDAELHVVGNAYVSSNLTVDVDTLHVDALTHSVGIETNEPAANLHVVGNVYVSSNLTVDTDTFHVDVESDHVGINTKNPDAELHVVGNVYVTSNLTVDTDTFHVDVEADHVGINTKNPDAELHVVGNAYVSSNLTVDVDTFHVDVEADHVGINTRNPDAELHVVGNTYVSGDLTIDTDTFHVDTTADHVGINTKTPDAELHVVGNAYVSSNLTVDEDTFHVDVEADHVGINTKNPDAELHVVGNAYVSSDLTVDEDTFHVEASTHSVGIETKDPHANLHVVGNVYVSSNLTIDTDTFHVDVEADHVGINTKNPDAELHVVGNVYVSSNLTVDTDTFHVDTEADHVGINTKNPDAELHVVGNAYVSSDLTVDTDTFHVDTEADHVGINTKTPDAELHVVGNAYVSSNLTVDVNTLHVDTEADHVGINTKTPDAELHVVGNAYVSSNLTVDEDTFHVDTVNKRVGIETKNPTSNLHVSGNAYVTSNVDIDGVLNLNNATTALVTDLTSNVLVKLDQLSNVVIDTTDVYESLRDDHTLIYQGGNWVNDYPKHTYVKVFNDSGVDIVTGNVVYVVGTHNANLLEVALAKSDSPDTMPAFGVVTSDIAQGEEGVAVTYGKAITSTLGDFVEGETVYVSNVQAGMLSNIKPYETDSVPNLIQNVGIVTKSGNGAGAIFVTGIGRANDVPNAQIVEDEGDINYVYVNDVNNDFKKIVPSNLLTQLQTLEQVTNTGNTTSNIIQFTNATTGIVTTANIQVGSNISVAGLTDPANKYLPMVDTTGTFIKSPVYVTSGGKYVISASEAEFLGNITLSGNTTVVASTTVTIEDRIFGVGANNSTTGLDSGFMIEHQDDGEYANIALVYHADEHRFSIGHTQNTFTDDHILHYDDPDGMLIDLRGNVLVQNNMTVGETITVTGASTLKDDLTVGLASNLFVDVSTSRVGINEASPEKTLDVNGTGRFKDTTDSSSTGTGALLVSGGLGVASNIHATNMYAGSHIGVGTAATTVPLEVRASGTDGVLVKNTTDSASNDAKLALEVAGATGGDPYITMAVSSGSTFAMGVDNSDSDTFKISHGSALGTDDRFTITTGGVTTVTNTSEATTKTDGALIVSGGLGVSKNVYAASLHTDDYMSHISDQDTRVGFPEADTFVVETAGIERVRVDSAGRLGVATDSPVANLHVVGNTYVTSNLTVDTDTLHVDAGTNRVGLGTSEPLYPLDVRGSISIDDYLIHNSDSDTKVGFPEADTFVVETVGTERVRVDSAGRLGVATNAPAANLHVVGNTYVTSNLTVDTDTLHVDSTTHQVGIETNTPAANLHVVGNTYISSNLHVGSSDLFVDVTSSSNVGIGTTIPTKTLHVEGDIKFTGNLFEGDSVFVTSPWITLGSNIYYDIGHISVGTQSSDANLQVEGNTYVSSNLTVDTNTLHVDASTNRVGLGTTEPVYLLDVNGTGRVTNGLITNTGQVAKKTYSFSDTIANGSQSEIKVYFSSNVFYSKITAQLNDLDDEVSTLVVECGGGSRKGTPKNIAVGTKNIFGSASTNPWSSTVGVGTDHVSFKPSTTITNTGAGDYHVFIEYSSPDATLGKTVKITKDDIDEVTFDY